MRKNRIHELIFIVSAILLCLMSCDNGISASRNVYFISVTSDYRDLQSISSLNATNHDQYGLAREIIELDGNTSMRLYLSSNGKRYILSSDNNSDYINPDGRSTKTSLDILPHKEAEWEASDILSYLKELSEKAGSSDLILFQYSGHGAESTGELVLGAEKASQGLRITDSITPSELLNAFSSSKCAVMIILDSCYSGTFIKDNVLGDANVFKETGKSEKFTSIGYFEGMESALNLLTANTNRKNPNVYVLAASTSKQTAWDSDPSLYKPSTAENERFGGFTYYLLKALGYDPIEDQPHENKSRITLYSLYESIWNMMRSGHRAEATPLTTLSPLDIILFNP